MRIADLPLEAQVTWQTLQLKRNDQMLRWFNDALATRGREFTEAKRAAWRQAQKEPMTRLAVELGLQT